MSYVEPHRTVDFADGKSEQRTLLTEIRYPAERKPGPPGSHAVRGAAPARRSGPFPLIVFGHGYDLLPRDYAALLNSWARAGYVVAAPAFPLENADAPGGPERDDLVNQPGDVRFLIEKLIAERAGTGFLRGMIDEREIAVAGHSDGGDTALAAAFTDHLAEPRSTTTSPSLGSASSTIRSRSSRKPALRATSSACST